jgi:hypothetical protein
MLIMAGCGWDALRPSRFSLLEPVVVILSVFDLNPA